LKAAEIPADRPSCADTVRNIERLVHGVQYSERSKTLPGTGGAR
jgi:hypothetical protein